MKFINPDEYKKIFCFESKHSLKITSRESGWLEFKESFNWNSKDKYAKSIASFANNKGGFIIFGVTNQPRKLIGLQNNNFIDIDESKISGYLNGAFSPEINFEKFYKIIRGKKIGFLCVYTSFHKPVVCTKNDGDIKEAEIYYRYNARSEKIKYAELNIMLKQIREKEESNWMDLFKKISKVGPANTAILNIPEGRIDGQKGTLIIDRKLIPKLRFIREGNFKEKGWPTLKLIGDVRPVSLKNDGIGVRLTNNPDAPVMRIEEDKIIEKEYPIDYKNLVSKLKERYTNFSPNSKFHSIKSKLRNNPKFCKIRYLDPINLKGSSRAYYSPKIIKEFNKNYTLKAKK
mgnify:CR=1 FL=1